MVEPAKERWPVNRVSIYSILLRTISNTLRGGH